MIVKFKLFVFLLCLACMSRCVENEASELTEVSEIAGIN